MTCSPDLGGELLCALKQLRHYHLADKLSWDEWRLSVREVERIDLENAANPEEADELEEMTADEMAVDGFNVVAGIAQREAKLRFASMQKPEAPFSCDTEIRFLEGPLLGEFLPFCPEWPQTPSPPDFAPEVACAT